MIQFQPAQDVKDALTGKQSASTAAPQTTTSTETQDPQQKPPLAMSISQSPKLAGLFTSTLTPDASQEATAPAQMKDGSSEPSAAVPPSSSIVEPTVHEAKELGSFDTAPVTPPADLAPFLMRHEPTDPHGVHDEAHPDEPEPKALTATASPEATRDEQAEQNGAEQPETQEQITETAPTPAPEAAPAEQQSPVTEGMNTTAPAAEDFKQRLNAALTALDAEIAKAEQEEARLLSEAAKATTLVKTKKAERKQLEALSNLDPAMLQSVFKVMQGSDEKSTP